MNRKDKRQMRIQIHNLIESECKGCEQKSISGSFKYCQNECPVGKRLKSLSASLEKEKRKLKSDEDEYKELKTGTWSDEEELYLLNHYPYFKIMHIAMRLNRAPRTVSVKLHSLKKQQKEHVC